MDNQRYAIYGINRVQKDFQYVLDELEIECYFKDDKEMDFDNVNGLETFSSNYIAEMRSRYYKLILCGFDKSLKIKKCEILGLQYGKDYIFESDMFRLLDDERIPRDLDKRNIIVWGTGKRAKELVDSQRNMNINFFVDSFGEKNIFENKKVYKPEEITTWEDYYVVVAMDNNEEVTKYLLDKNLHKYDNFIDSSSLTFLPSVMMSKTIFDTSCYDLECNTTLNHLEIYGNGRTACCCVTFLRVNMGDYYECGLDAIWNSNIHKILDLSTQNKTYYFCDKTRCPLFFGKHAVNINESGITGSAYKPMEKYPKALSVGIDSTCNLSCVTCRKEVHIAKGREKERSLELADKIVDEILPKIEFLILAGDGEVFFSECYKNIYKSDQSRIPQNIRLLSNATLFNEKNWKEFASGRTGNIIITASIDAATKETYEYIRRNGKFENIERNMEFASRLREEGSLAYLRMNFVVQRQNYKEMIPFVQWASDLGADEVFFTKILNWGTYTAAEFRNISMMEEDEVTPLPELLEVLQDPVMHNPIVDLGTIQYADNSFIKNVIYCDNYYEWELMKRNRELFDNKE